MDESKHFKPMNAGELLALTGQVHDEDFKYQKMIALYSYISNNMTPDYFRGVQPVCIGVIGLNLEEKRVVDIAVHPYFRKLGMGKALVNLAVAEYDVEFAYTNDKDAEKFWKSIGWGCSGDRLDKGTRVKVWVRPE